jgi:hypothetical protein
MLTPWGGDAVEGRLHVVRCQLRTVVELHALAQVERVGFPVLCDIPAVCQVRYHGLAAVTRIAPDQIVEQTSHRPEVVVCARLVQIEMRHPIGDPHAQNAAMFWRRIGRRQLERRSIELIGDVGKYRTRVQPIAAGRQGGPRAQKTATAQPSARVMRTTHYVSLP